jgi:hypothetical protein
VARMRAPATIAADPENEVRRGEEWSMNSGAWAPPDGW